MVKESAVLSATVDNKTCVTTIAFRADDGFPLSGTLFEGHGTKPMVLISSATAVPQHLYRGFAIALIEAGAKAVFTYDYRGTGASPSPKNWTGRISYKDWAIQDFPAALTALQSIFSEHDIVGLGQSFGGHALGLSGKAAIFKRYAMVATMSGYTKLLDDPYAWPRMNLIGVPMSFLFRDIPRWMGIGEPMPSSCFRDWARWCRMKDFLFDDPLLPEKERYKEIAIPILAVGLIDDPWATPRAMAHFLSQHKNAQIEQHWISPQEAGGKIGHLGFFRSRFSDTLWPHLIDWLLDAKSMEIGNKIER